MKNNKKNNNQQQQSRRVFTKNFIAGSFLFGFNTFASANTTKEPLHISSSKIRAYLLGIYGNDRVFMNNNIQLKLPVVADSGCDVTVHITTHLPELISLSVFADSNPDPLVINMNAISDQQSPFTIRMRLLRHANVFAIAQTADGKLHANLGWVKNYTPCRILAYPQWDGY